MNKIQLSSTVVRVNSRKCDKTLCGNDIRNTEINILHQDYSITPTEEINRPVPLIITIKNSIEGVKLKVNTKLFVSKEINLMFHECIKVYETVSYVIICDVNKKESILYRRYGNLLSPPEYSEISNVIIPDYTQIQKLVWIEYDDIMLHSILKKINHTFGSRKNGV